MAPHDLPLSEPFRRQGTGYVFEPVDERGIALGVRFGVDLLARRTDGMTAELVIESALPGGPTRLFGPDIVHLQTSAKVRIAKEIAEATPALDAPTWIRLMKELAASVVAAERMGDPIIEIGARPPVGERRYHVARLLPAGEITLLYGPWAVGKGHLATHVALCVAAGLPFVGLPVIAGPVLYLDWEDTQANFEERVWLHARGLGMEAPPDHIYYRKMRSAFGNQVDQIARFVEEFGVSLVTLDSVGLAAGLVGERGSYEDNALALFEALRYLPTTTLLIDHVSEEGRQTSKTVGKAYGSIYKMALCRNAWELRKDQPLGAGQLSIGLYHTKANHGPLLQPLALGVDFRTTGCITVAREDLRDSPELSGRLPATDRIALVLRRGPLAVKEIAGQVDMAENAVRTYLSRGTERGLFRKVDDHRWANVGRENGGANDIPF